MLSLTFVTFLLIVLSGIIPGPFTVALFTTDDISSSFSFFNVALFTLTNVVYPPYAEFNTSITVAYSIAVKSFSVILYFHDLAFNRLVVTFPFSSYNVIVISSHFISFLYPSLFVNVIPSPE